MGIFKLLAGRTQKFFEKFSDFSDLPKRHASKEKQRAIATGTDGKNLAENLAFLQGNHRTAMDSSKQQNRVNDIENAVFKRGRRDSNPSMKPGFASVILKKYYLHSTPYPTVP